MKPSKTLIILALLSSALVAFAQTGTVTERFRAAQEAFDSSQFEKALTLLDAMEKDLGKSPRIESLRALTLRDLNRPRDAYLSLLAYFKLTEGMNLSNSAAHKSLIELRDTLRSQLETDLSAKKDNLQSARNENAQRAISGTDTLSKPDTQASTAVDPLAELEMWNKVKTSTNAMDFHLFIMRFPGGSFAKLATAKMNELGDPQWNEVKKSKDPFVYRDYINKNPNSPFVTEAKDKMNMLAASTIAWEQIKDSKNVEDFSNYLKKYPDGSFARDAKRIYSEAYTIILKHWHSGFSPGMAMGKLEFNDDGLQFTEFEQKNYKSPKREHNMIYTCDKLRTIEYPHKTNSIMLLVFKNGDKETYFTYGDSEEIKVSKMVEEIKIFCKLN